MKYKSKYTDKPVSPAQIITERVCELIAKNNKTILVQQFWNLPEWNKIFRRQIATANKLLQTFSQEAILRALSHPKASRTTSLGSPWLKDLIKAEQKKLDNLVVGSDILEIEDEQPIRPTQQKESILDKLQDL